MRQVAPAREQVLAAIDAAGISGLKYASLLEKLHCSRGVLDAIVQGLMHEGELVRCGTYYSRRLGGERMTVAAIAEPPSKDMRTRTVMGENGRELTPDSPAPPESIEMRECRACDTSKPLTEFYGEEKTCKACRKLKLQHRSRASAPAASNGHAKMPEPAVSETTAASRDAGRESPPWIEESASVSPESWNKLRKAIPASSVIAVTVTPETREALEDSSTGLPSVGVDPARIDEAIVEQASVQQIEIGTSLDRTVETQRVIEDLLSKADPLITGCTSLHLPEIPSLHAEVLPDGSLRIQLGETRPTRSAPSLTITEDRMDQLCEWWRTRRVAVRRG